jgi:hypothetical protein
MRRVDEERAMSRVHHPRTMRGRMSPLLLRIALVIAVLITLWLLGSLHAHAEPSGVAIRVSAAGAPMR